MSHITDVMLSFSLLERQEKRGDEWEFSAILRINEWLERIGQRSLFSVRDNIGPKLFAAPLYISGFNYFDLGEFLLEIERIDWRFPPDVQLFVEEESRPVFRLYRFAGQWLEMVDLAPPDGVAVIVVVPAVYNGPDHRNLNNGAEIEAGKLIRVAEANAQWLINKGMVRLPERGDLRFDLGD